MNLTQWLTNRKIFIFYQSLPLNNTFGNALLPSWIRASANPIAVSFFQSQKESPLNN